MNESTIKQSLSDPQSLESLLRKTLLSDFNRDELEETVACLASKGWNRKRFYDVCRFINLNEDLLEEGHDGIGNFIDELTGYTSTDDIIKLPGEPEDKEEFLNYLYSDWSKQ